VALCYRIPYRDRFGQHQATKWGDTPADALARVKRAHDIPGRGVSEYSGPQLVEPQPFDTSRHPSPSLS
jgi:hypothetical protein